MAPIGGTQPVTRADRIRAAWDRFWFLPQGPTHLAICRIVICAAFYKWFCYDATLLPDVMRLISLGEAFHFPQGPHKYLPVASAETIELLHQALGVALLASAVGFATRISTFTACALLFYLSQAGNYGKLIHVYAIPIIVLGILALSHCGAALSVDRWLRSRWRLWRFAGGDGSPSGEYRWPLQFLRLYVCMVFFMAALSKLFASGPAWVTSDNLMLVIAATPDVQGCLPGWPTYPELNHWLAQQTTLLHFLAGGVLLGELLAPLALIPGRIRIVMVSGFVAMSLGFRYVLGPSFEELVLTYLLVFIPWDRIVAFVGRKVQPLRKRA